jgi:transposase
MTQDSSSVFVGIDVAKDKLDLARSDSGELSTLGNDAQSIAELVNTLKAAKVACIVVEATGGLEQPLVDALLDADLPVATVNPGRIRHFAIGIGILAKSDPLDAGVLMKFARLAQPRLTEKRSKNQVELDALITCRRQLVRSRTDQGNCRLTTHSPNARRCIDAVLKEIDKQIAALDEKIRRLIDSDDDFKHLDHLLKTVPGVGPVLSATLTAELRELGQTSRQQVGALVGVAPFNHDSGRFRGKRAIRGGRAQVRKVLYMASIAAMRCNQPLRSFAQRLKAAGKASKVIIVACMRKLLTWINAMIRDNLTWDELRVVKNA